MEREAEGKGAGSKRSKLSVVDSIKEITSHNARSDLNSEHQMMLYLQSWWSRTYNRPLKDPILMSYTMEELLYEFYDRIERQSAEHERANMESDRIDEDKEKANMDWAQQEEMKELEQMKLEEQRANELAKIDPTKDPENIKWMEEQVRKAKDTYGEDFGEDISFKE